MVPNDLKHAFRMLARNPGYTLAAVAALALGIGANTAIFSVINTVLLKPLTYPDPDRIVQLMNTSPNGTYAWASIPNFSNWRDQTSVLEDVAAFDQGGSAMNITGAYPEQLRAASVTADYFRLFGARFVYGRGFTPDEDRPHAARNIVLSYALWQRRFAADPGIVGKTVDLSGEPYVIIGVTAPDYRTDPVVDAWVAFRFDMNSTDQGHYFFVAGRLKPGVTLERANAQLKLAFDEFRRKYPLVNSKWSFGAKRLQDQVVGDARISLMVLAGAVSFVLLIACANVANLLLARAAGRKREIALRTALGAGRGRVVRQLLTESVVLFLAGGLVGLALGVTGVHALLALSPGDIPRIGENGSAVSLDWRVFAFTVCISLVTGIVFGLIPALGVSRADLNSGLKESGNRSGTGVRHNITRSVLVIGEMALSIVLLIGAALLIRTFVALRTVDPGFNPHNVLTMSISLSGPQFQRSAGVGDVVKKATERVQALPGVVTAAGSCCLPLLGGYGMPFIIAGRPLPNGQISHGGGAWVSASPGYFETFQIPIRRGRSFNVHDDSAAPAVVIINQAMARKFWSEGDPLADRLIIGKGIGPASEDVPRQIVGIVGDVHDGGLNRDPQPTVYVPLAQIPDHTTAMNSRVGQMMFVTRTQVDPRRLSRAVEKELQRATGGLAVGLPMGRVRLMDDVLLLSTARADFDMLLLTIFGVSALLLAAIGIYGLSAYSVHQRTSEIGIRMALGATASDVRWMVLMQGMRLVWIGTAIGLMGAFGLSRVIGSFLFGVKALDPAVYATVPVLLSAVALFAVWFPARRATRIAPSEALRYE
jgi:predicted permease